MAMQHGDFMVIRIFTLYLKLIYPQKYFYPKYFLLPFSIDVVSTLSNWIFVGRSVIIPINDSYLHVERLWHFIMI